MAKLGERVSTGAWIYALGNGLRAEFKESKDGILYSKDGFNTVMSVKTKLLNEEAVLTSKSKQKDSKKVTFISSSGETEKDDEIVLVSALKITGKKKEKKELTAPTPDDPKDNALFVKGKGGKGGKKGKGHPKGNHRWSPHGD
jgi:hypothetical protein